MDDSRVSLDASGGDEDVRVDIARNTEGDSDDIDGTTAVPAPDAHDGTAK